MEKARVNIGLSRRQSLKKKNESNGGDRMKIVLPLLLATVTGVLLGICLLVLFKGQASEPTVTTIPAPNAANGGVQSANQQVKGAARLSGFSLYVWQLGSFQDRAPAEKAQQEFAAHGVQAIIRGAGPYQLFAAVAPDKKAGQGVESELQKSKTGYYAKEFNVQPVQGLITGLKEADAQKAAATMDKGVKLAGDALAAVLAAPVDASRSAALKEQAGAMQAEWKAGHDALLNAGLKNEAAEWDSMSSKLFGAVESLAGGQGMLTVEAQLTSFYVSYESLAGHLIKNS